MELLLIVLAVGFAAQLIDGSLGMGYGVLSTSLLLAAGIVPAVASATVHIAKVGTAVASGAAHWRFGNVDGKVALLLGIPGALGGYLGAVVLSNLSLNFARPYVSGILLVLGLVIIGRFLHGRRKRRLAAEAAEAADETGNSSGFEPPKPQRPAWLLAPLGLIGGFVDASGGGGWGPVTTSTLMASGRLSPRTTIGTVNAAELLVALSASAGFLQELGSEGVRWDIVGAMLIGGVLAAIPAAWLVRHINERTLGIAVGVLILVLSIDSVLSLLQPPEQLLLIFRVVGVVVTVVLLGLALFRARSESNEDSEPA
ncbi:MAG TPA: sulfite exporter TauE/SafE family protein [Candidatus Limnocylindrales bacterium]|nr:sulfite exporter TauE/SafE family protein [Candidatus Limnocylindrales bacterium]